MTDVVIVWTTVPDTEAGEALARALVDSRLAACVSLSAPITSIYRWDGRVAAERERQLWIKTTAGRVAALRARLESLHPYEVPEFLICPVADGSAAYLGWVRSETTTD